MIERLALTIRYLYFSVFCPIRALLVLQRLNALKTLAKNKKCAALEPDNVDKNRFIDIIPGQFLFLSITIYLFINVKLRDTTSSVRLDNYITSYFARFNALITVLIYRTLNTEVVFLFFLFACHVLPPESTAC